MELAKLHSRAVDYVKTGVPAEMEKKLTPKQYPHFMEKPFRKTYRSTKILGQMYDAVSRVTFTPNYETPFDSRILKRYTLDNEMLKKARHIKTQYDTAMKRIMGQMEIRTEFEVLSAFVMSKPLVGTQYKQHETVRREADALKQQFKDECIQAAGGTREFKVLAPFVAAMYQITNEEVQIALYESRTPHIRKDGTQGYRQIRPESMPLISFPWLFDGILGRIAKGSAEIQAEQKAKASDGGGKEAPSTKPAARPRLDPEDLKKMEYARTSSGIIHRGQILRLFHHDDEDELIAESEEEELQQEQQQSAQESPVRHERQPTADPEAGTRPSQQLPVSPSLSTRPAGDLPNKFNNGPGPVFRAQTGIAKEISPDKFQPGSQKTSIITTTTSTTTTTTIKPDPDTQRSFLPGPEEDLISFDSPPSRAQDAKSSTQDFAVLSLLDVDDMDEASKGYVAPAGEDYRSTFDSHANARSRSGSVGASTNAVSTAATSGGGKEGEKEGAEEGSDVDGDDAEFEEVVIEKKSAFDGLARLA